MRRQDEQPEVGDLWQVYDPYNGEFFDAYVVKRTKMCWEVLEINRHNLLIVSLTWFWTRIA